MTIIQLSQPLPFDTIKGPAVAHFLIDYGTEHHVYFVCFVVETGECWVVANPEIRLQSNWTMGSRREFPLKPIYKHIGEGI